MNVFEYDIETANADSKMKRVRDRRWGSFR